MRELICSYLLNLQRQIKEKKQWICWEEKMNELIEENKLRGTSFDNSTYIGTLCVQAKMMIRTKRTYLLYSSTPAIVFLFVEKLLTLWFSNFQTFSLFLLIVLWKSKHNCMSELFCIANLLEVGRRNIFFNVIWFNFPPNQNQVKYSNNKF